MTSRTSRTARTSRIPDELPAETFIDRSMLMDLPGFTPTRPSSPPVPPQPIPEFSRYLTDAANNHPQTQAMLAYARAPILSERELLAQHITTLREASAQVASATRTAFVTARAALAEAVRHLEEAEAACARISAARPRTLTKQADIDKWALEAATADRRRETLQLAHADAVTALATARQALHAELRTALQARRHAAEQAVGRHRAARDAALLAMYEAKREQTAADMYDGRLRDNGVSYRPFQLLLEEL